MVSFTPAKTRVSSARRGRIFSVASAFCLAMLASGAAAPADAVTAPSPCLAFEGTPEPVDLDSTAYAQWVDGQSSLIDNGTERNFPEWIVWTRRTTPGHTGLIFGHSANPGARHLQVAFKKRIPVGTVIVNGGGVLSVLKPDAPFPGNLSDETHWQAAQRLAKGGRPTSEPVAFGEIGLWVLPPDTGTQALRFTHVARAGDEKYQGRLGSVLVTSERLLNHAPSARVATRSNHENAAKLVNGLYESWGPWENREHNRPAADNEPVLSATNPEWITLAWRAPVKLSGLVAFWAGLGKVEVQSFAGPAEQPPEGATDQGWKTVATFDGMQHGYPSQLWPSRLDFGHEVITRAVRLRVLSVNPDEKHDHIKGRMLGGRRVWLGELMAIESLDAQPIAPLTNESVATSALRFSSR